MAVALPATITRSERLNAMRRVSGGSPVWAGTVSDFGTHRSSQPGARRESLSPSSAGQRDDAVVVRVPPVDDARSAGFLVHEQVEVVADHLHLEQRVVDRHGFGRVFLLTHDVPRL